MSHFPSRSSSFHSRRRARLQAPAVKAPIRYETACVSTTACVAVGNEIFSILISDLNSLFAGLSHHFFIAVAYSALPTLPPATRESILASSLRYARKASRSLAFCARTKSSTVVLTAFSAGALLWPIAVEVHANSSAPVQKRTRCLMPGPPSSCRCCVSGGHSILVGDQISPGCAIVRGLPLQC